MRRYFLFLAALGWLSVPPVGAEQYPSRPIRVIVANTPGGGADTVARLVGEALTNGFGQQTVVDNRGGAGGRIGMQLAARSEADGYTLVLGTGSNLVIAVALYSDLGYEPLNDFVPVSLAATTSYLLVAHPSVAATTARELIDSPPARAGSLNYASTGPGTFSHLAAELLKMRAGINMTHVAFKGSSTATLSLVQGETQIMFSNFIASLPLVRAKRLRALGVTSLKRSPIVPSVPTIHESGIPGFEMQQAYSVWAPRRTNPAIVKKLNDEIGRELPKIEAGKKLSEDGTEITVSSPAALREMTAEQTKMWRGVVQKIGLTGK